MTDLMMLSRTREIISQNDRTERLLSALVEHQLRTCPHCNGTGRMVQSIGTGSYVWGQEGGGVHTQPYRNMPCSACSDLRRAWGDAVPPETVEERVRTVG